MKEAIILILVGLFIWAMCALVSGTEPPSWCQSDWTKYTKGCIAWTVTQ